MWARALWVCAFNLEDLVGHTRDVVRGWVWPVGWPGWGAVALRQRPRVLLPSLDWPPGKLHGGSVRSEGDGGGRWAVVSVRRMLLRSLCTGLVSHLSERGGECGERQPGNITPTGTCWDIPECQRPALRRQRGWRYAPAPVGFVVGFACGSGRTGWS